MNPPVLIGTPARLVALLAALVLLVATLVLVPAAPGRAGSADPVLVAGELLRGGESVQTGGYRLVMQTDGNLVVYASGGRVRWHSRTPGHPGARAVMQGDGNLVVYSAAGRALWDSGTWGNAGSRAVLQSDGNLVVYSPGNRALWHIGADAPERLVDASGLYAIRGGVAHGPCGDPGALALDLARSRTIYHAGTGWDGQIVAVGGDAPALVRAWQASPPHVAVAAGSWSRMSAGAARGADGRMYGVVNFCR